MNIPPKVIGFLPVYNAEIFLTKTLISLENQNYENFEIWICDDASSDQSFEICKEFSGKDSRFKVWRNDSNLGWWKCSQIFWEKASQNSKYCFFQAHDDIPYPDFIQTQVKLLEENPQALLCVPGIKNSFLNRNSESIIHANLGTSSSPSERIIPLVNLEVDYWWSAYHGLHRSDCIARILPLTHLRFGEKEFSLDLIWLIKLAGLGKFVCSDSILFEKIYSSKSLAASWKNNFVNRSATYLAIAEETLSIPMKPQEKVKILMVIFKKSLNSLCRKLSLSK